MIDNHAPATTALVDGHVHIHPCVQAESLLDAALENFRDARQQLGISPRGTDYLLLTETNSVDRYDELKGHAVGRPLGPWTFVEMSDGCSLVARRHGEPRLILVSGRQVATRERMEVLVIGTRRGFGDGAPIDEVIDDARASGGLAVIPWGFGKWWFGRGTLLRQLIARAGERQIFLGDNGGRPRIAPQPRAFDIAASTGVHVLPGSDPLPLPMEFARAGSYGFMIDVPQSSAPGDALKHVLRENGDQPAPFGRRVSLSRFLSCQIAFRWRRGGVAGR